MNESDRVLRHRLLDRLFHWTTAACFFVLLATGLLPIFGIKFNWVTLHWVAGVVLATVVVLHSVGALRARNVRYMWVSPREFVTAVRQVIAVISAENKGATRPGKYSVAQKVFHFAAIIVVFTAVGTGIVMMIGIDSPFWDRDPYYVTERTKGLIFVAHDFATLCSVTMIIVHVYFAARPEKRYFMRSMLRGWITRREYEDNHDSKLWEEESQ